MNKNGVFSQIQAQTTGVYSNLDQDVILITEDRLRLVLQAHTDALEKKSLWLTPFSIALSIILTLVTADFKSVLFEASTWKAFF